MRRAVCVAYILAGIRSSVGGFRLFFLHLSPWVGLMDGWDRDVEDN